MGVGDLASAPERTASNDDARTYLDLQPPIESEELYISSHFADEPLYQFYTAAIIEVTSLFLVLSSAPSLLGLSSALHRIREKGARRTITRWLANTVAKKKKPKNTTPNCQQPWS